MGVTERNFIHGTKQIKERKKEASEEWKSMISSFSAISARREE